MCGLVWARRLTHTITLSVVVCVCVGVGSPTRIPADRFLDRARFEGAQSMVAPKVDPKNCRTVSGALVNHHALASDLLRRVFQRLSRCRPDVERIIILSPDHFFQGRTPVTTGEVTYTFGKQEVSVDSAAVQSLVKSKIAVADQKLFRKEHGVGVLVPFLVEAFPKAKLVPIVIRADLSQGEAERLVVIIKSLLNDRTLVIVSSDMSHYLSQSIAIKKDRETQRALKTLDTKFFWKAKDDHLDFGKGMWVALKSLEPVQFNLIDQANSVQYGGTAAYTTSYMTGVWE